MAAHAIVILGSRVGPSGRPAPPLDRRIARGARAYHEGLAPVVVARGGKRWRPHVEAQVIARELVARGVPRAAILEELFSLSTFENAIFTAALLGRLARAARPRVHVATCSWHMRRALQSFSAVGLDASPLPAEPPPMRATQRLKLELHEAVCRHLDARAIAMARPLRERADAFFATLGPLAPTQEIAS